MVFGDNTCEEQFESNAMTEHHRLPVGLSDFRKLIEGGYYYVDKSLLIRDVIDAPDQTLLIPRPRRFGKTLNLSMLRCFFEKNEVAQESLFHDLDIWAEGEEYREKQGRYPVVCLTLKDVKALRWEDCLDHLKRLISEECRRHLYLADSEALNEYDRREFELILCGAGSEAAFQSSLGRLIQFLERYHGEQVVLLIDEYDQPIHAGFTHGYDDDVIVFMRNWLSGALKDNSSLGKGVLTGILRVAKESIFSGLNNVWVYGILAEGPFSDKFGFTESEVARALRDFGREEYRDDVDLWYNGYDFCGVTIYNPWSVLGFLKTPSGECLPHWLNTSSNDLIHDLLSRGGESLRGDLETLMAGEALTRPVDDSIVLRDVEKDSGAIWSFLLLSGNLTAGNPRSDPLTDERVFDLSIPNREIRHLYQDFVRKWLGAGFENDRLRDLLKALVEGDTPKFGELLQSFAVAMLSYHDVADGSTRTPEVVYQAFTLGLLANLGHSYTIRSNRESGLGRADILMIPKRRDMPGIVMELKSLEEGRSAEAQINAALEQIEAKGYRAELEAQDVLTIHCLAIVFEGTRVHVAEATNGL